MRVRFLPDDAPVGMETGAIPDRIIVPQAAVQSGPEGSFVWVVSEEVARKQAVQVGASFGQQIEVTSGVNAGDRVVVNGAERLSGETAVVRVAE